MESQLQHTHGRHYDDADLHTAGHHTGHDYSEEQHGEKKSVIKKVKEKAKKLKNTITKHGHGHGGHDHHDEDEDDEEEEMEEDAEVHGAPMYDSARADAVLAQPRGNLERPSVMAEDRYTGPAARHGAPQPATNLFKPSGVGDPQGYGQEVNPEKWKGKIGTPTGMEEEPFAPNPTRVATPITVNDPPYGTRHVSDPVGNRGSGQDVNQGGLRGGNFGKATGMVDDPHAPMHSVPSIYETKVTDPTHTGVSQIQRSLNKMGIRDEHDSGSLSEPKTFDHNHPENLPRDTVTGNPSSRSSSYAEKISTSASAIADKAADMIASTLGYSSQSPKTEPHETAKTSPHEPAKTAGGTADYAHKITDKVTGTLAPVYEKVVDAGSAVMSKVQGSVSGTGNPEVQSGSHISPETKMMEPDKGVSVKEYLAETLKPGEEDKALSEKITHALHRGNQGEFEKKSGEDRPIERVTESVEVRERLGTARREEHPGTVSTNKGVTERLSDAMGSWFSGKGNTPEGSRGTSYVTDEGLSSNPAGDHKGGTARGH